MTGRKKFNPTTVIENFMEPIICHILKNKQNSNQFFKRGGYGGSECGDRFSDRQFFFIGIKIHRQKHVKYIPVGLFIPFT